MHNMILILTGHACTLHIYVRDAAIWSLYTVELTNVHESFYVRQFYRAGSVSFIAQDIYPAVVSIV